MFVYYVFERVQIKGNPSGSGTFKLNNVFMEFKVGNPIILPVSTFN